MENHLIDRPLYMSQLEALIDVPVIKVLTGIRRSGKSTLLLQVQETIKQRIPDAHIISLNFESAEGLAIRSAKDFLSFVNKQAPDRSVRTYFFFDELQRIKGWEDVVNALRVSWNADIFLTGSNATMLSGDLATNLAGRYVSILVRPFVFSEFHSIVHEISRAQNTSGRALPTQSNEELFSQYLNLGGYPMLKYFNFDHAMSMEYLRSVYDSAVKRDVITHHQIRDIEIFERILDFCIENIGRTFSAQSIARFLKNERRTASVDTVLNYLKYCEEAFIISRVPRYNIRGKELLRTEEKYFITDLGLRSMRGFSNSSNIDQALENVVFNELAARGYEVNIGAVPTGSQGQTLEIDFVARKNNNVEYYQVSYLMESEETRGREFTALESISDNYPKTILSLDQHNFSRRGIRHENLIQWLLNNEAHQPTKGCDLVCTTQVESLL